MLFNSIAFLFGFLPLVLGITWLLPSRRARLVFWTVASWAFYAVAGPGFVALLLASTVVDFVIARRLAAAESPAQRRGLLVLSVGFGLTLLGIFKYSGLLATTTNAIAAWLHATLAVPLVSVPYLEAALPAGISFYTFMTISYTVDVYRGEIAPETDFWRFACFIALFPHLIAGPVLRARDILPQLAAPGPRLSGKLEAGLLLFTIGLGKKVLIADTIGLRVDGVFRDVGSASPGTMWLAALGFALQVYFDFSGYSDMARGLGWMLGLDFTINFDNPYRALDPRDFWRRWHVSLSSWFRDYVYVPLGGSRGSRLATTRNLVVTMVLVGVWHGAGWNFIAFGAAHGAALAAYHRWHAAWDRLPAALRWAATFGFVVASFVLFRARSLAEALVCYRVMFSLEAAGLTVLDLREDAVFAAALAVGLLVAIGIRRTSNDVNWAGLRPAAALALGLVAAAAILKLDTTREFVYFQF